MDPTALSLKDPGTDRLARRVASMTGETLTQAVRTSLAERLARERLRQGRPASLNLGDCLSDARANATGEPLLFIGYDVP